LAQKKKSKAASTKSGSKSSTKSADKKKARVAKDDVPFEESLAKLRSAVDELENGNLTLSDSLEKYEQGVANLKQCYAALNSAQRQIEMLVDLDEEGNLVTRPFNDAATFEAESDSEEDTGDVDEPGEEWDEDDESDTLF
jgi:exodeoxyribonuclease VII small subunit